MKRRALIILITTGLFACKPDGPKADLILSNGRVYTVDRTSSIAEAVAMKDGLILGVGSDGEMNGYKGDSTEVIDLKGQFVYPGFIEGHAHIMGIGANLVNVDLSAAKSYSEVVELVRTRAASTPKGEWIVGRGWHQDKWERTAERMQGGFPTHQALSQAVPDHPVWLVHASGHAGLANERAMDHAGISKRAMNPSGGEIIRDISGNPTGIFNETAAVMISGMIPQEDQALQQRKLALAIEECLKNGITGFHQAGSDEKDIRLFEEFAGDDKLKLRLYVMLDGSDTVLLEDYFQKGPQVGLYNDRLTIRSVKLYADGALGSRGAWLLDDYQDAPGVHGHNVTPLTEIESVVNRALQSGFQVCTHAIGDRANREVLDIYQQAFQKYPEVSTNHRFRIEHAQHIDPEDIPRFAALGVIPAMQAIHMSSDRPWAIDRLGKERIETGAYMWSALIDSGARIVNGTDAPVEPVSSIASFYASVTRMTLSGKPEGGYEATQKMTREEALKSYTLWAAYGAFMDDKKGSIVPGKLADLTILDRDIMTIPENEILATKVIMTIIGGKPVYMPNQ